jgi:dihydroorotase
MKKNKLLLLSVLFFLCISTWVQAQSAKPYSIVIKGGHVIDPKNNIDGVMDIAVTGGRQAMPARAAVPASAGKPAQPAREAVTALPGKIALVAKNIDPAQADQVINAAGMYVTPGIIDIHVHTFVGTNGSAYKDGPNSVPPDGFTFRSGVTTVVDAGSPGWRSFPNFKKNIIDRSKTRVLAFLNIVGEGMGGGDIENNTADMDPVKAAQTAKANPEIVGFKVAHFEGNQWIPVDSAVKAGNLANMPVMVDFGGDGSQQTLEQLFASHLRPGDIQTHTFHPGAESPVDDNAILKPYVLAAQKKGMFFDVGHGGNGFSFKLAIPSMKQGFIPNSISSDLHIGNMNAGMKDMTNIMSKFLNMGMPLKDVVLRSTWNPAKEIKREELGNLSVGSEADLVILNVRKGEFGFIDSHGFKLNGTQKIEAEVTIRSGRIVWNLNGMGVPTWDTKSKIVNGY